MCQTGKNTWSEKKHLQLSDINIMSVSWTKCVIQLFRKGVWVVEYPEEKYYCFSVEVNEGYSNSQTSKIEERSHDIFGLIYRQATGVLEN